MQRVAPVVERLLLTDVASEGFEGQPRAEASTEMSPNIRGRRLKGEENEAGVSHGQRVH